MESSSSPIYIWLNGARDDEDAILILQSKKIIKQFPNLNIVEVRFNSEHFSSGDSIAFAISWVFQKVDSAIILEDDIMPSRIFLDNTCLLLKTYSNDLRVGSILGSNFVPVSHIQDLKHSYRTSDFVSSWGWATWSNRWSQFEFDLKNWDDYEKSLPVSVSNFFGRRKWKSIFESIQNGEFDAWDYRWQFSSWKQGWVNIVPNSNLVQNIGFGVNATHTFEKPEWFTDEVSKQFDALPHLANSLDVDIVADRWVAHNIHPSGDWYWLKTYVNRIISSIWVRTKRFASHQG